MHLDLHPLLSADGADAENGLNVDHPQAPDLHGVLQDLVAGSDQDVPVPARDPDHVVGDQPVPPLHEIERRLALPDAAPSREEKPHSVHVHQGCMDRDRRSENPVQVARELMDERGRILWRAEHRHLIPVRALQEPVRKLEPLGHDDGGHGELEEPVQRLGPSLRAQRPEVGDLGAAEDLDPLEEEVLGIAHQRHAGPVDVADRDRHPRFEALREDLERERLALLLVELRDGDLCRANRAQGLLPAHPPSDRRCASLPHPHPRRPARGAGPGSRGGRPRPR